MRASQREPHVGEDGIHDRPSLFHPATRVRAPLGFGAGIGLPPHPQAPHAAADRDTMGAGVVPRPRVAVPTRDTMGAGARVGVVRVLAREAVARAAATAAQAATAAHGAAGSREHAVAREEAEAAGSWEARGTVPAATHPRCQPHPPSPMVEQPPPPSPMVEQPAPLALSQLAGGKQLAWCRRPSSCPPSTR